MLLTKNLQFLPNQADILPFELVHWTDILTKFHSNWTKIVDFSVIATYFAWWTFFWIWSQCVTVKRKGNLTNERIRCDVPRLLVLQC